MGNRVPFNAFRPGGSALGSGNLFPSTGPDPLNSRRLLPVRRSGLVEPCWFERPHSLPFVVRLALPPTATSDAKGGGASVLLRQILLIHPALTPPSAPGRREDLTYRPQLGVQRVVRGANATRLDSPVLRCWDQAPRLSNR